MKKEQQEIKINKVEIKIGDKTLSLKMEEVIELKDILNKYFEPVVRNFNTPPTVWPYYLPYMTTTTYPYWTVTCQNEALCLTSSQV